MINLTHPPTRGASNVSETTDNAQTRINALRSAVKALMDAGEKLSVARLELDAFIDEHKEEGDRLLSNMRDAESEHRKAVAMHNLVSCDVGNIMAEMLLSIAKTQPHTTEASK